MTTILRTATHPIATLLAALVEHLSARADARWHADLAAEWPAWERSS